MNSGHSLKRGLPIFSLAGDGAHRGEGGPLDPRDRRAVANKALIRHRQKAQPRSVLGMSRDNWCQYVAWQLEWENAILRYRDGNNDEAERTLDDRRHDYLRTDY